MCHPPFDDAGFDVATSFRGIWGNGLEALREAEVAAQALASTGPAYLAIQHLGEAAFMASARAAATGLYVEGLGVRAEVELQFLVGVVPP